jgi:hypothetical protein
MTNWRKLGRFRVKLTRVAHHVATVGPRIRSQRELMGYQPESCHRMALQLPPPPPCQMAGGDHVQIGSPLRPQLVLSVISLRKFGPFWIEADIAASFMSTRPHDVLPPEVSLTTSRADRSIRGGDTIARTAGGDCREKGARVGCVRLVGGRSSG